MQAQKSSGHSSRCNINLSPQRAAICGVQADAAAAASATAKHTGICMLMLLCAAHRETQQQMQRLPRLSCIHAKQILGVSVPLHNYTVCGMQGATAAVAEVEAVSRQHEP